MNWVGFSHLNNSPGNSPAESFLSVLINQIGQMLRAESLDKLPRRLAARHVKPPIQWSTALKTKPTIRVGQLVARQTEVQQDAVDRTNIQSGQHLRQIAVVRRKRTHRQPAQFLFGTTDGDWIAIERNDQPIGADGICQ